MSTSTQISGQVPANRSPHPFLFTLLIIPFGAISGFVSVVLAFLATRRGLTVEEGASLIAIGMLPHAWKFFWAPVADMTFSRKGWYVVSNAVCALGVLLMSAIPLGPENLRLLQVVIFTTNLASTVVGMAVEGLMAHATAPEERGRVGGWFQAGNLGGSGIGGGLGLWLATHFEASWVSGAVLAAVFVGCGLALLGVHDPGRAERVGSVWNAVKAVGLDLWGLVRSRAALTAAILCFLPIGTGAASGVLAQAEVAARWGSGESEVGMVNGVFSGIVAAIGCILGGQLCGRFGSTRIYAAVGALMALVTGAMALSPLIPTTFVVFGLVYAFVTGLAYAAFSGLVLETIGTGAAATKYNIYASLSNIPIGYMGLVLAWAIGRYGATGMLFMESAVGLAGIAVFAVAYSVLRPRTAVEQSKAA
ncbi:MAG: MFS transporter [Pseudomonadota bacterium]|nr:MFS transporter [Pseudomonadota bacterium]